MIYFKISTFAVLFNLLRGFKFYSICEVNWIVKEYILAYSNILSIGNNAFTLKCFIAQVCCFYEQFQRDGCRSDCVYGADG